MRGRWFLWVLATVVAFSLGRSVATGQLLFAESFRYPSGPLIGQGPPTGAPPEQSAWQVLDILRDSPLVAGPSLRFRRVFAKGSAVSLSGITSDAAVAFVSRVNTGVVWIGFTMNVANGDSSKGFADLHVGTTPLPAIAFGLINDRGVLGIDNDTGFRGDQARTNYILTAEPAWVVVKLDFDQGFQALFINPTTVDEPRHPDVQLEMRPDFQITGFDQVSLVCGGNDAVFGFDEVRIGLSYADVRSGP